MLEFMIEDYIPSGYENRVSRDYLHDVIHIPDRGIRRMIEDAADRGILIVSADGGYFRPTKADAIYVGQYFGKEDKRFRTISHKRKIQRQLWEQIHPAAVKKRDQIPGQLSIFEVLA